MPLEYLYFLKSSWSDIYCPRITSFSKATSRILIFLFTWCVFIEPKIKIKKKINTTEEMPVLNTKSIWVQIHLWSLYLASLKKKCMNECDLCRINSINYCNIACIINVTSLCNIKYTSKKMMEVCIGFIVFHYFIFLLSSKTNPNITISISMQ